MSGDVRRRIGALERVAGDGSFFIPFSSSGIWYRMSRFGAESGDGEPIDLAALAEAVAVSIERYSGEASARGYVWRSLAEVIGEAVQE